MANINRKLHVPVYKPQTNEAILNGIRKNATDQYKTRVPRATQAAISETQRNLASHSAVWNEFLSGLVNQVGAIQYKAKTWTGPFGRFKGPMLEFGDTIEEVATGLIKAHVYDPDGLHMERLLFGQHRPDAITSFHKINRQDVYALTINRDMVRRAFTSEYGLSDFISGVMEAPATSDQWDEFHIIANLMREYADNGGYFRQNIPDLLAADPDGTSARAVLKSLRTYARLLPFLSTNYNAAGVPSFADADELVLIGTPEFLAALDVDGLASLFNVEYGEVNYRTVPIPSQYMPAGIQAILTVDDFFVIRDTLFETTNQPNAAGLTENFFLHHHGIYSLSRFVPAVAFTTGPGTVITVAEEVVPDITGIVLTDEDGANVAELTRGRNHVATATITTEPDEAEPFEAVVWSVSGNEHSRTRVSQTGIVSVSPEDTAPQITLSARAVSDDAEVFSVTYPVSGDVFRVWPNPGITTESVVEDADA